MCSSDLSIVYDLQSDQFPRIRIGMGGERKMALRDFVTGGFTKEEKGLLEEAVERAALASECIVAKGIDKAMNEYNIRHWPFAFSFSSFPITGATLLSEAPVILISPYSTSLCRFP